jgi:hypothetical protein
MTTLLIRRRLSFEKHDETYVLPTVKSSEIEITGGIARGKMPYPGTRGGGNPLEAVTPVNDAQAVEARWALIERIAASSQLRRANRLQELLYFLGKRSLTDHCESLHEQAIGVGVFGRPASYDTSSDNIVRTSVSELRKRLQAYFDSEGRDELLTLEIPRWNYVLSFRERPVPVPVPAAFPVALDIAPPLTVGEATPQASVARARPRWVPFVAGGAIILLIGLATACLVLWNRYRAVSLQYTTLHRSMYGWQYDPQVAELWNGILNERADTDIVLADASFGLLQDINRKSYSLDDYLNRSYIQQVEGEHLSPDLRAALDRIAKWNLGSQDEFMLARRILALDPSGNNIRLYSARSYIPALTKRDNVILIGGRLSNPWQEVFGLHSNFAVDFAPGGTITVTNRSPGANEAATYVQTASAQYCVISYGPNTEHSGVVLLIQGTDAEATEAAGDFLLSGDKLAALKKVLRVNHLPYFEVLLRVSSVPGTPLTTSIEAYRAYPH